MSVCVCIKSEGAIQLSMRKPRLNLDAPPDSIVIQSTGNFINVSSSNKIVNIKSFSDLKKKKKRYIFSSIL